MQNNIFNENDDNNKEVLLEWEALKNLVAKFSNPHIETNHVPSNDNDMEDVQNVQFSNDQSYVHLRKIVSLLMQPLHNMNRILVYVEPAKVKELLSTVGPDKFIEYLTEDELVTNFIPNIPYKGSRIKQLSWSSFQNLENIKKSYFSNNVNNVKTRVILIFDVPNNLCLRKEDSNNIENAKKVLKLKYFIAGVHYVDFFNFIESAGKDFFNNPIDAMGKFLIRKVIDSHPNSVELRSAINDYDNLIKSIEYQQYHKELNNDKKIHELSIHNEDDLEKIQKIITSQKQLLELINDTESKFGNTEMFQKLKAELGLSVENTSKVINKEIYSTVDQHIDTNMDPKDIAREILKRYNSIDLDYIIKLLKVNSAKVRYLEIAKYLTDLKSGQNNNK